MVSIQSVVNKNQNKRKNKKQQNEIKQFLDCRWISSIEAAYCLFEFSLDRVFLLWRLDKILVALSVTSNGIPANFATWIP